MREMVALNVINRPTSVIAELNIIVKVRKYKGFLKRHHFIPMAMEVHNALRHDMDHFIKECAHLFHDKQLGGHLSLSFYIQYFKQCVSIAFQCALASTIERKIALVGDACFRPPIIIRSHDLHVNDIRKAVSEIASTMRKTSSLPLFGPFGLCVCWPFFGLPFLSPLGWFQPLIFLLDFCFSI